MVMPNIYILDVLKPEGSYHDAFLTWIKEYYHGDPFDRRVETTESFWNLVCHIEAKVTSPMANPPDEYFVVDERKGFLIIWQPAREI